ncbi:unnamed protein product [Mytilus edulis]|uniref:Uncharacterized protein n=1 Tax=Mytilus edulis TaxID=6550 RepID=A0A8S3R345_MYTED|nr:unnamed protein product [Mytilus edulis]
MNSLLFNSAKSCCPTPRKRYRKPKLKVMNEDISGAIAMKKKAFYQWKINGRSEDPRNELYIQKKETTYNLRKHCRKAVAMNRIDEREKIMEANIKNKNSFYRLIKKQRGRLSNHIDELSVGDTVYSTENNILSGWKHHFENLTKNSIHEHFDNKYQQKIEQEYIDIIDICRAMFQHQSITENEIVEALKLLNLNKSPDIFGVSTENLLYGGQSLIYHLKELLDNDLAILSNCPYETQILIDMAFDFSKREAYLLQPAKSCVIQSKSRHHEKVNENFWNLGNSVLPTSNKATHIGICRTDDDSCKATIDENLKKARRTLYSLMGVGLYGENGLDPQTSMSIMNTYIIPIMFYGLEIVIPRGRCLETLNIQFKKFLKQLLSLPKTVADPAIYMISGIQGKNSIEWQLAERQLNVKSINSNSWFSLLRKIFLKYELNDPAQYLVNPISKYQWKREITSKVQKFWIEKILNQAKLYTSLRYLSLIYKPGQCHPIANTNTMNSREIIRIPTKLKIATGSYILQTVRAKFKSNTELSICKLCNETEETLPHFLLTCKSLEDIRKPILEDLINSCSEELAAFNMKGEHFDILQLIIDPFNYMTMLRNEKVFKVIQNIIDPKCGLSTEDGTTFTSEDSWVVTTVSSPVVKAEPSAVVSNSSATITLALPSNTSTSEQTDPLAVATSEIDKTAELTPTDLTNFLNSATIPIVVSSDGSVQILTTTTAMNTYLGQNSFPNTGFYPPQYAGAAYAPELKIKTQAGNQQNYLSYQAGYNQTAAYCFNPQVPFTTNSTAAAAAAAAYQQSSGIDGFSYNYPGANPYYPSYQLANSTTATASPSNSQVYTLMDTPTTTTGQL